MLKKMFFVGLMFFLSSSVAFASFTDVDSNHHLYSSITWLQDQGVVVGYEDGSFRPDNSVNRAEFLKMLYEAQGVEVGPPCLGPFSDMPTTEWYTRYVCEALNDGVVDGYDDGTFRPGDYINFAEATKIIANAFFDVDTLYGDILYSNAFDYQSCHAIALNTYPSVDTEAWYWPNFAVLDNLCVMSFSSSANVWKHFGGDPVANLVDYDFGRDVSRADMAEMLYRAKAVSDNENSKFNSGVIFPDDVLLSSYCTDNPVVTDSGSSIYPMDPKYAHLDKLGQLFTAADCGGTRVSGVSGVDGDYYTLGARILLNLPPSDDFRTALSSIGFECIDTECTEIELWDTITVVKMLLLEPYYAEMSAADCTNCG